MCLRVSHKRNMGKKFFRILKVSEERSRIRIHTKMSRIPITGVAIKFSCENGLNPDCTSLNTK
jgi:hypothetical protein